MSTFKITVDDDSELGCWIQGMEGRGRSREIHMLATLGVRSMKKMGAMPQVAEPCLKQAEVPTFNTDINDSSQVVDFGEDLLRL